MHGRVLNFLSRLYNLLRLTSLLCVVPSSRFQSRIVARCRAKLLLQRVKPYEDVTRR